MAHTPGVDIEGMITVEIKGGTVTAVRGLPENYQYEVLDRDVQEHESEALYLATVNVMVRATSPGYAVDAMCHILHNHPTDYGTLVDWDYAVQDGVRQSPKCVSLDLEPGNITELLDHIAQ